ncbi:MAG: hypothetical protein HRU30_03505 [Rhodobacteraceae bacterium]|nr:hypothetical protein [Paracoccaceae bacterium]
MTEALARVNHLSTRDKQKLHLRFSGRAPRPAEGLRISLAKLFDGLTRTTMFLRNEAEKCKKANAL